MIVIILLYAPLHTAIEGLKTFYIYTYYCTPRTAFATSFLDRGVFSEVWCRETMRLVCHRNPHGREKTQHIIQYRLLGNINIIIMYNITLCIYTGVRRWLLYMYIILNSHSRMNYIFLLLLLCPYNRCTQVVVPIYYYYYYYYTVTLFYGIIIIIIVYTRI